MDLSEAINKIHVADSLEFTRNLPDNLIDTIIFSPPYWGLRSYGEEVVSIIGGKIDCEHDFSESIVKPKTGGFSPETANVGNNKKIERTDTYSKVCSKCGAWSGQVGQEPTWHDFIKTMVLFCTEFKRVMKEGGSMWVNIGDTFWGGGGATGIPYDWESISTQNLEKYPQNGAITKNKCGCPICIPKQKIGMPMRLRLALNDIGLISRDDIIWHKPNHMPGSQTDRFTVSYEYLFRFVKNTSKKTWWYNQKKREWTETEPHDLTDWHGFHYYFDLDSVRRPHKYGKPAKFNIRVRDAQAGRVKNIGPNWGATEEEIQKYDENAMRKEAIMKAEAVEKGYSDHSAARTITGLHYKHSQGIPVAHELGKTPNDIYEGKYAEDSEEYNSPRARQAREGYEPSFYHPLGGNPSDFWQINPRANKFAWCNTCKDVRKTPKCRVCGNKTVQHYAGFPEDLVVDPITVSTPLNGIVYDPFVGCYDDKTELLTNKGWIMFSKLTEQHEIATLDQNGYLIYNRPINIFKYEYKGKMNYFESSHIDLCVTPNHRMFVYSKSQKLWRFVLPEDIRRQWHLFKRNALWKSDYDSSTILSFGKTNVSIRDFAQFLGFWMADGHVSHGIGNGFRVGIKQRKYQKELEQILSCLPFKFKKSGDAYYINNYDLWNYLNQFGYKYDRFVPDCIKFAPKEIIERFLDGITLGDGSRSSNGSRRIYTCSKKLADGIQELFLKVGTAGTVFEYEPKSSLKDGRLIQGKLKMFMTSESKKHLNPKLSAGGSSHPKIGTADYDGMVYCAEILPTHLLYVRRNGKACWCGNSGTTAVVAAKLGRNYIGVDLNESYVQIARWRLAQLPRRLDLFA